LAAAVAIPAGTRNRWIIGRGVDLTLVSGSSLAGFLYIFLYAVCHVPISYLWWFWSVGFDGTHIFATATRTYFDPAARRRDAVLLYGSAGVFFALGPALVLIGAKYVLAMIVAVWAYYHVVRQHYGFMVLYKVKNRDLAPWDNFLDRAFLGVMLVAPPFLRFFVRHPEELGLPFRMGWAEPLVWVVVAATGIAWGARQWRGPARNVPKYLLFLGVVPLHWLTFALMSWQAAVPTVTIVHNLQYHALVWFHNRNRYAGDSAPAIPRAVTRSLAMYVAAALVFSAAYRIPGFHLGKVSDLAFGFFCGFGLTHYYLDSRIWRVRHDPELKQALRLA
jgi:hypothetical protein